ncbi:DUF3955 domain-containing protein [Marinobacterium marinum]|uniref:DUF3955 domain-containing protein n=1 Tax=Marinobacterium marinum TaxID=2756129 RepID=A0A7W1WX59_9GAMM|nr:DUF3955 domain-containing protein [Marinobacterium marinum]MBA4501803.1 DUF3955 domain-containing protein [Marinobacterium marinum]
MLKKFWALIPIGCLCLFLSFACLMAFRMIGSEVGADGVLREPFALLPLSWLLAAFGCALLIGGLLKRYIRRKAI